MTKAKKLSIGLALIIICALVAAAVWKNWTQLGLAIGPSCGLKVNGANSSIVIKGWTSPFVCGYLKNKYNTYLAPLSNNPTTQTVCVYKYDGDMIYTLCRLSKNRWQFIVLRASQFTTQLNITRAENKRSCVF